MSKKAEVIAAKLTTMEREFSILAGAGKVPPGTYLTNDQKAEGIIAALEEAGYRIKKKPQEESG